MIKTLDAPFSNLDSLRVLAGGLEDDAFPVQSSRIVWAFLQGPIIVEVGAREVAHLAVAGAHIVTEL